MIARFALCALVGFAPLSAMANPSHARAAHVVLIVWDGMRSNFVTEKDTPTLWKLAREGVTFRHHHSVYPTLTSVNATALATGVFPGRGGPIGNYEYRPEIDAAGSVRMDAAETVRKGDEITNGKYLAVPTIAELVQASGGRTAVAGTKSAPLLFDRTTADRTSGSVLISEGATLPESARAEIEKLLGPYPNEKELPSIAQDKWTTDALTEVLWKDRVPEFSVLWMGDPDRSEHASAPGSAMALAAIKSADDNLALVLRALEKKGLREKTDLLVVSDHGFSTIESPIDLKGLLEQDGFPVAKTGDATQGGAIHVVGNGGTVFFYVAEHQAEMTARLVAWLQKTNFTGVIFSRAALDGTFPLSRVHLETPTGPDIVMSFRWNDRSNENGVNGLIEANGSGEAKGTHGTLSPFDVHNILFAAGPDFRAGLRSDLPSSNLDVPATILNLLGLKPAHALDGRILTEALRDRDAPRASETRVEEAKSATWRQFLRVSKVGPTEYLDEGNGSVVSD